MWSLPSGIITVYSMFSLNFVYGVESLYLLIKRSTFGRNSPNTSTFASTALFLFFPCPEGSKRSRQKSCENKGLAGFAIDGCVWRARYHRFCVYILSLSFIRRKIRIEWLNNADSALSERSWWAKKLMAFLCVISN